MSDIPSFSTEKPLHALAQPSGQQQKRRSQSSVLSRSNFFRESRRVCRAMRIAPQRRSGTQLSMMPLVLYDDDDARSGDLSRNAWQALRAGTCALPCGTDAGGAVTSGHSPQLSSLAGAASSHLCLAIQDDTLAPETARLPEPAADSATPHRA